jgi:hypothetical protein
VAKVCAEGAVSTANAAGNHVPLVVNNSATSPGVKVLLYCLVDLGSFFRMIPPCASDWF